MNKRKMLATALAGVIALNTLGGCTSSKPKNSDEPSSEKILQTDNIEQDLPIEVTYKGSTDEVETINACVEKNEYNELKYYIPKELEGFVLIENKGYRIEETRVYTYPAVKTTYEDGTVVYSCPYGGRLVNRQAIIEYTRYLSKEEAIVYLTENGYMESKNATLSWSM